MFRSLLTTFSLSVLLATASRAVEYDIVIYGGTSAAITAAVQARKMGKSVIVVSPDKHLGGLSSGGLGFTDTGNKAVIGGLSREFYHRVWQHYDTPEAWRWQKKDEYGNKGQGTPAIDGEQRTMWIFEPHVAEQIFEDFVKEFQIPVERDQWLDRAKGVKKDGARIASITTLSGKIYSGKMFIDATYEGDLMAAAGVSYHVGREAQSTYGEKWNGVQTGILHHRHHFGVLKKPLSPYVVPGDPTSGVLPQISTAPPGEYGAEDKKVQAYCYRYCVTDAPENRLPLPKPDGYDPKQYELLVRVYEDGWNETFKKFDPIPNHKTDCNNHGPFSTDNIGLSWDYPEAGYERRREILKEHETYQKGWLYFIAHDPRVPAETQKEMQRWGLPKDEFKDNGGWPHQIYVREARRMIGEYVMTENDLLKKRVTPDSVGMGSYGIDSHNVQRYITPEGHVQNEGDIGIATKGPYGIAYGSIVPRKGEVDNLLVPVCVSSSHIAFGSIRMEPVFMILGESAATAAALAIDDKTAVQAVPYAKLRKLLLENKQILEWQGPPKSAASGGTAGWQQQATADAKQDRTTIAYDGIPPNKLVCDTTLRELPDGSWTLLMLAGDNFEPSPGNYTGITKSTDQGKTWTPLQIFDTGLPRKGRTMGQGPTELMILGNDATLFFSTHSQTWGRDWQSWMKHSHDACKTWDKPEPMPGRLASFTFIRNHIVTRDGRILIPFQHYNGPGSDVPPPAPEEKPWHKTLSHYVSNPRNGVLISSDRGKTWSEHGDIRITTDDRYHGWAENNIVEMADGRIAMIIRGDRLGGVLYYAESKDGGKTWPEFATRTDIPNPGSKATLYSLGGDNVAILHNPNPKQRSPLALWISFDGMKTWPYQRVLVPESSDGPKGRLNYPDGFVSKDKRWLHFAYDDNRHRAVVYSARLPKLPASRN